MMFSRIRLMSVDHVTGTSTVVATDGTMLSERGLAPGKRGLVERTVYLPQDDRVEVSGAGTHISMLVGTPRSTVGVPVVYLDQNHWIYLARWFKNADTYEGPRAEFYSLISEAAEAGSLVLPLSAAHLSETSKRPGWSRLELASVMLRLSQGWQLRDVLPLRRAELRTLFGTSGPLRRRDVVTLDPEAILDMESDSHTAADLPVEFQDVHRRVVWASVLVSLLLDDNADPPLPEDLAGRWAGSFPLLTEHLIGNGKAKARARDLTRTRFISDVQKELASAASEAGLSPEQFGEWLASEAEAALSRPPGLSRMREVLHLRLWNAHEKWEANDLNDWMYLSYASGYTDLVVGERKMMNYLRRVNSLVPQGALLHHRPEDALDDLKALLAKCD